MVDPILLCPFEEGLCALGKTLRPSESLGPAQNLASARSEVGEVAKLLAILAGGQLAVPLPAVPVPQAPEVRGVDPLVGHDPWAATACKGKGLGKGKSKSKGLDKGKGKDKKPAECEHSKDENQGKRNDKAKGKDKVSGKFEAKAKDKVLDKLEDLVLEASCISVVADPCDGSGSEEATSSSSASGCHEESEEEVLGHVVCELGHRCSRFEAGQMPPDYEDGVACSVCDEDIASAFFHCETCEYDVCAGCVRERAEEAG